MRVARFEHDLQTRVGIVEGEAVRPLPAGTEVLAVLADPAAAGPLGAPVPLAAVRLLAPAQPVAMRDFLTFQQHVEGVSRSVQGEDIQREWFEAPSFLFMNPHAVIGTGEPVEMPPDTTRLDFELEVAAVIGRDARNVTPEEARGHIAGYLIMNDWSARDLQGREMKLGLGPAKGKDFATTLGPWIVTADELADYRHDDRLDLRMTVSLNGRQVGADRLSHMAWSFEQMVAYASRGAWVRAGDVLASGTCATGALAETWGRTGVLDPPPLRPGDVVTMAVEGIGEISNPVVEATYANVPIPPARPLEARRG